MLKSSEATKALLQYWQETAFRENIGRLTPETLDKLKDFKEVWVAPCVLFETIIPMWIPAEIREGQLYPSSKCALPWLPMAFFDLQSEVGTLFKPIEFYDKELLDHFFDEEGKLVIFGDWNSYLEACMKVLRASLKSSTDFNKQDWMIGVPENEYPASDLLTRYTRLENADAGEVRFDLRALNSLVHLKPGDIAACTTPVGSKKIEFIKTLAACWTSKVIVWVGLQKPELDLAQEEIDLNEVKSFSEGLQLFDAYETLKEQLIKQFGGVDLIDTLVEERQAQDQKLEAEFERCTQRYREWQKEHSSSLWTYLLTLFPYMKARRDKLAEAFFKDYLKVSDEIKFPAEERILNKIRQIKVVRTKIHNELVDMSQWLASKNGAQKRWERWLGFNGPIEAMGNGLMKNASVKCLSIEEANLTDLEIDYLVIDHADKMTAAKVLPLLAKAKTVLFLGEEIALPIKAQLSPIYDTALLKAYQLADTEEALEDLFYKGIHALGSAFCVAKATKSIAYDLRLSVPERTLKLEHIAVSGQLEALGLSYYNQQEAEALLNWIASHPDREVAVLTLFQGQKNYLGERLKGLDLDVPVLLLNEANALQKACILFSPVYTSSQPRPYLLDEGEAPLRKLQSYAAQALVIFGDSAIFDPNTHTPSGQIAKLLFSKEEEICPIQ